MLDFNSHHTTNAAASDVVNGAIDGMLHAARIKQERRTYLGASAVGDACIRRAQFDFAGAPRESEPPPKILRIFDRGHVIEELARKWLSLAGFVISQASLSPRYAFSQLDGRFRGHVDGVIVDGPKGWAYPLLWEHKALGAKGYREVTRDGVAKARPGYADQVAIYQAYVGPAPDHLMANPAMFTVTNADTMEQAHLPVPFDAERAQRASDRAVRIIQATDAGELLPRPFADPAHFECKSCAFAQRCWSLP